MIISDQKDVTACFTGHRRIKPELLSDVTQKLDIVIARLAEKGIARFLTGGALGFDTLAARRVIEAKKEDPRISLTLVLPCRDQTKMWTRLVDINEYRYIKEAADEIVYIQEFYDAECMMKRNIYMVDSSSVCIAYFEGRSGGTQNTVKYAKSRGVSVINLSRLRPQPDILD